MKCVLLVVASASLILSIAACDENPTNPPTGDMAITASAPPAEIVTADGWSIKVDRFLVSIPSVTVTGREDGVVAASSTPQIIDQVAPGAKTILLSTVRVARAWEDVAFSIGPATADSVPLEPVTETDRDTMTKEGFAIYIEAKATKAATGAVKNLKVGFRSDTTYSGCAGDIGGVRTPGLVVPVDGNDTADVSMSADVLFSDDLTSGILRGEAIAAADADNDGLITTSELHAYTLDAARTATGAQYVVSEFPAINDLGSFIDDLAKSVVKSFRSPTGKCTAAPTVAPQ